MSDHSKFYKVLTIAGFDGSGGAGIQADLKTFSALGCYGMSALTALPVQNTLGVQSIYDISSLCLAEQIKAILDDIQIHSLKIGMLHSPSIIEVVTNAIDYYRLKQVVVDPVMVAKSGDKLLQPSAIAALKKQLFPLATVLTPNLLEASEILGRRIQTKDQMEQAAIDLVEMGPMAVVVKGGHLNDNCDDCLCIKNEKIHWFYQKKILTKNTHGTGCTFSAAIASFLGKGYPIVEAVSQAKDYITKSIQAGAHLKIGHGNGPVHHFHYLWNFLQKKPV